MGTFVPTRVTPDGQRLNYQQYDDYMANQYNPQQQFNSSASAPIPGTPSRTSGIGPNPAGLRGLLGGVTSQWMNQNMSPADWVSMLPPGQIAPPAMGNQNQMPPGQMPNQGPYGQQAMQLAGLLSPQQPPPGQPPSGDTYPAGLLGGKRPFRPVK